MGMGWSSHNNSGGGTLGLDIPPSRKTLKSIFLYHHQLLLLHSLIVFFEEGICTNTPDKIQIKNNSPAKMGRIAECYPPHLVL
jgi:hypothetical protein